MTLSKEEEDKIRSNIFKLGYLGDEIHLDPETIYIVSGLERSGTSLMMQMMNSIGAPIEYDNNRLPDQNNPNGYFELFGGKIINRLINKNISMDNYKGKIIKITSYGLKYLPAGYKYKIIYMVRDMDEIVESMQKMIRTSTINKKDTKDLLWKLQDEVEDILDESSNINYIKISYNKLVLDPSKDLRDVCLFLGIPEGNVKRMIMAIDVKLYKERKKSD